MVSQLMPLVTLADISVRSACIHQKKFTHQNPTKHCRTVFEPLNNKSVRLSYRYRLTSCMVCYVTASLSPSQTNLQNMGGGGCSSLTRILFLLSSYGQSGVSICLRNHWWEKPGMDAEKTFRRSSMTSGHLAGILCASFSRSRPIRFFI